MSPPALIKLEHLTKYYGKTLGIRDISFTVLQGEIFGFLGPNGAGKTTTIRILLDLLRPTDGNIFFRGRHVTRNSLALRRHCGYLPGNYEAYGSMKGADYLRFLSRLRNTRPVLQQQLLDRFQFSQRDLRRRIKQLSHGTRQKLGIVQAFFHEPELLILDEPTKGLDPLMQVEFYDLLREFQAKGHTIFFSSHNLPEVEKVCHRMAIIRTGRLVALETLEALRKKLYRRLAFTLERPVEKLPLPEARLIRQKDLHYEFYVKGDLRPLLEQLARLPLHDLVFPEPDLEEVFMTYYRSKDVQ